MQSPFMRPVLEGGLIVDVGYFCCEDCWRESLRDEPPSEDYPGGGSVDAGEVPCAQCASGFGGPEVIDDHGNRIA